MRERERQREERDTEGWYFSCWATLLLSLFLSLSLGIGERLRQRTFFTGQRTFSTISCFSTLISGCPYWANAQRRFCDNFIFYFFSTQISGALNGALRNGSMVYLSGFCDYFYHRGCPHRSGCPEKNVLTELNPNTLIP
jgi:hypothetical protein